MADTPSFSPFAPGFEFLQTLVKNAGAALPSIGQWVAPTLDPDELAKRIEELRTVQFWLEQNARMLGATIQAMEVQKMTLSTLKTMNVQMEDLRESMKIRLPDMPSMATASAPTPMPTPKPAPIVSAAASDDGDEEDDEDADDEDDGDDEEAADASRSASPATGTPLPGVVDPMQWWGALTKQFTDLAAQALKDTAGAAVPGSVTPPSTEAAKQVAARAAGAAQPAATRTAAASGSGSSSPAASAPKAGGKAAAKTPARKRAAASGSRASRG